MKIAIGIFLGVIVLAMVGIGAVAMVGQKTKLSGIGTEVRLYEVTTGQVIESINAPGEVQPRTKVSISARITARILELPFEEGQAVTAGDANATPKVPPSLLIQLDATDLKAILKSAKARRNAQEAQILVAKARLKAQEAQINGTRALFVDAEHNLERQTKLFESKDVSESAYDQAKSSCQELDARLKSAIESLKADTLNIKVMEHTLEAADADIARAEDDLSYTTITSPIDGIVTKVNAEVGELVMTGTMNNAGTVILEVADLSTMMFLAQVDEVDIGGIRKNQKATLRLQAYPDQTLDGIVDSIALTKSMARDGSTYYEVEILIQSDPKGLLSGLTGDLDIETSHHSEVLKVPSQAVLGRSVDELPLAVRTDNKNVDQDKTIANVVYRFIDGKAIVTPVIIGPSDNTHTVILSGLAKDDKVIVGPYKTLESIRHDQSVKDEKESLKEKLSKEKEKEKEKETSVKK